MVFDYLGLFPGKLSFCIRCLFRDESASATYSIDENGAEILVPYLRLKTDSSEFETRNKQVNFCLLACIIFVRVTFQESILGSHKNL